MTTARRWLLVALAVSFVAGGLLHAALHAFTHHDETSCAVCQVLHHSPLAALAGAGLACPKLVLDFSALPVLPETAPAFRPRVAFSSVIPRAPPA